MNDRLEQQNIAKLLEFDAITPVVLESVPSTNTLLHEWADAGRPEGTLLLTDHQTAGRGRRGRSFHSPQGTGLYMSLLLRPTFGLEQAVFLTTACAVCAAEAVEALGVSLGIKWVNDLYRDGKKVAGILTEAVDGGIIVGIGLNLYPPKDGFPAEIQEIAGSIFDHEIPGLKNRLAAEWADRFWAEYQTLSPAHFLDRYRARSVLLGRAVTVLRPEGGIPAIARAINDRCELVVETFDGKCLTLSSGEVSIRL